MTAMHDHYYFGCLPESSGHYLYTPELHRQSIRELPEDFPTIAMLDGGYLKTIPTWQHGVAVRRLSGVWTVLSFWDCSGDARSGSNSAFIINGIMSFDRAVEAARAAFPAIWARFPFTVVPAELI